MSRQVRVVAGKYRGKKLSTPLSSETRVTKDRVKEAVFSALSQDIYNCTVLDLFAGIGSFGIEALSRGAKSAIFVENNRKTLLNLKENVLFLEEKVTVINKDYQEVLDVIPKYSISLLFLDPPYEFDMLTVISDVEKAEILTNDAIIVCETKEKLNFATIKGTIKEYQYGNTHITIIWRDK